VLLEMQYDDPSDYQCSSPNDSARRAASTLKLKLHLCGLVVQLVFTANPQQIRKKSNKYEFDLMFGWSGTFSLAHTKVRVN